jgi:hypothetical protein
MALYVSSEERRVLTLDKREEDCSPGAPKQRAHRLAAVLHRLGIMPELGYVDDRSRSANGRQRLPAELSDESVLLSSPQRCLERTTNAPRTLLGSGRRTQGVVVWTSILTSMAQDGPRCGPQKKASVRTPTPEKEGVRPRAPLRLRVPPAYRRSRGF